MSSNRRYRPLSTEKIRTSVIADDPDITSALNANFVAKHSSFPMITWWETGAAADNGVWNIVAYQESLRIRASDDSGGGDVNAIQIDRTGTTIDKITLGADVHIVGSEYYAYDATNTDYIYMRDSGTQAQFFTNNNPIWIYPQYSVAADWIYYLSKDSMQIKSDFLIFGGHLARIYDSTNTDYVDFSHDGTDFNFTFTNTADFNLTGASNVKLLAGMDLWIHDAGNTDYVQIYHDGTDVNLAFVNTSNWLFRDGVGVRVYDSGDTDYIEISHDGTNARFTFGNTGVLRIEDKFEHHSANHEAIALRDTGGAGTAFNQYIAFRDSADTRHGYIGFASASSNDLYFNNEYSGGSMLMYHAGAGDHYMSFGSTGRLEIEASSYKSNVNYLGIGKYVSSVTYVQNTYNSGSTSYHAGWTPSTGNAHRTYNGGDFYMDGYTYCVGHPTTASAANAFINSSSGLVYRSTSSERYKTNIRDVADQDLILQLRPVVYNSTSELDDPSKDWYGFIAEEVLPIIPNVVDVDVETEEPEGVFYDRLVPLLVKKIQEQEARIAALEATP